MYDCNSKEDIEAMMAEGRILSPGVVYHAKAKVLIVLGDIALSRVMPEWSHLTNAHLVSIVQIAVDLLMPDLVIDSLLIRKDGGGEQPKDMGVPGPVPLPLALDEGEISSEAESLYRLYGRKTGQS